MNFSAQDPRTRTSYKVGIDRFYKPIAIFVRRYDRHMFLDVLLRFVLQGLGKCITPDRVYQTASNLFLLRVNSE
jgi:hypothetical protein